MWGHFAETLLAYMPILGSCFCLSLWLFCQTPFCLSQIEQGTPRPRGLSSSSLPALFSFSSHLPLRLWVLSSWHLACTGSLNLTHSLALPPPALYLLRFHLVAGGICPLLLQTQPWGGAAQDSDLLVSLNQASVWRQENPGGKKREQDRLHVYDFLNTQGSI